MLLTADLDDVRRVAAASPFRMKRVDRPAFHRGDGMFHKARLVERIGRQGSNQSPQASCPNLRAASARRPRPSLALPMQQAKTHYPFPRRQGSSQTHRQIAASAQCATAPACRLWPTSHVRGPSHHQASLSGQSARHPQSAAGRCSGPILWIRPSFRPTSAL